MKIGKDGWFEVSDEGACLTTAAIALLVAIVLMIPSCTERDVAESKASAEIAKAQSDRDIGLAKAGLQQVSPGVWVRIAPSPSPNTPAEAGGQQGR